MAFLDEIKKRLDESKALLEDARKVAREAKAREIRLTTEMDTWQQAYQAELGRSGKSDSGPQLALVDQKPPSGADESKAETIRAFLQRYPAGLTPAELRDKLKETGVVVRDAYIYSVMSRGYKTGKLRLQNGKYSLKVDEIKVAS